MATILKETKLASGQIKFTGNLNNDEVKKIAGELDWEDNSEDKNTYLSNNGNCYVANDGVLCTVQYLTEVKDVLMELGYLKKPSRSEYTKEYIAKLNKETEFNFENSSWSNDETDSARDDKQDLAIYFPYPGHDEFYKFVIYPEHSKGDDSKAIIVDTIEDVISELKKISKKEFIKFEDLKEKNIKVEDFLEKTRDNQGNVDLESLIGKKVKYGRKKSVVKSVGISDEYYIIFENLERYALDLIIDLDSVIINNNNNSMTTQEKINWLNSFIQKWNDLDLIMDETEKFLKEGNLQAEYDAFLLGNNLPSISADDLVADLVQKQQDENKYKEDAEKNKPEKTAFNDATIFVDEFGEYLIGKSVKVGDIDDMVYLTPIKNVSVIDDYSIGIDYEDGQNESNPDGIVPSIIFSDNFQGFIDGDVVEQSWLKEGKLVENKIMLKVQEDLKEDLSVEEALINLPENRYYISNVSIGRIYSGHEYREDAASDLEYRRDTFGDTGLNIYTKKELVGVHMLNPDDNSNWLLSKEDYSIIEEAVKFGVTEGDYSEESAKSYIDKYKQDGKFLSVIKARLVYYMEHADKHFKNAIVFSDYEKAMRFKEIKERTMSELLNIIKKDI